MTEAHLSNDHTWVVRVGHADSNSARVESTWESEEEAVYHARTLEFEFPVIVIDETVIDENGNVVVVSTKPAF